MTIVTKPILAAKDEKAFLADFEGPPNVTVTIPVDAPTLVQTTANSDAEDAVDEEDNVRVHNKVGGFKCLFFTILAIAGISSGFCFFRALHAARYRRGICALPLDLRFFDDTTLISGRFVKYQYPNIYGHDSPLEPSRITKIKETLEEKLVRQANGQLGLEYEIDVESETFEMTQMPQLSRGKYLHDFKMNKTLIIDTDHDRCFVMALNRAEISPPKDFMDFINHLNNGVYQLDLGEVRHETRVVLPPLEKLDYEEYGFHIVNSCRGMTSYLLEDVDKLLDKRSTDSKKAYQFVEFGGKNYIKYHIVNLDEIDN